MSVLGKAWLKRLLLVVTGAMLVTSVSGCTTFLERLKAETSYHHARPAEVKTEVNQTKRPATVKSAVTQTKPPAKPRQFGSVGSSTLKLSVIFYERLLVPTGATLTVKVTDAKGRTASSEVKTTTGLPYKVDLALGKATAAPFAVEVVLKSPAGHVLSGKQTIETLPGAHAEFLIATGGR